MAARAATKAATKTVLALGEVEASVGLYSTTSKPDQLVKFDTAGPNGGKLKYEQRGTAAPVEEQTPDPERGAPLGDPGPEDRGALDAAVAALDAPAPNAGEAADRAVGALVDGEFRQVLVEDGTGEVVEPDQVRRGVRLEDGRFVDVTDQLDAIEARTKLEEMRIVAFIDVGQVPRGRVTASYYVGTDDPEALPVLALIREAMRATRRAAVVRWSSRSRQSLGVLVPYRNGPNGEPTLMALKLAWAEDFRDPPARARLGSVQLTEPMVESACELVEAMSQTRLALDELRDDALALREELLVRARAGEMDATVVEPAAPAKAPDVMAALEGSLAAARGDG